MGKSDLSWASTDGQMCLGGGMGGGAGDQGTEVIEAAAGKLLGGKSLMRTCVC